MRMDIREMHTDDCQIISDAFKEQGWNKPTEQYLEYFKEMELGVRDVLIAELDGQFAGYVTILWTSEYAPFRERGIPEIVDLNVLIRYRNCGIASLLLDEAEKRIRLISKFIGIGVGMFHDYGAAQRLYVKRGYVPDGKGIWTKDRHIGYGETVVIDDDVALYLIKEL